MRSCFRERFSVVWSPLLLSWSLVCWRWSLTFHNRLCCTFRDLCKFSVGVLSP